MHTAWRNILSWTTHMAGKKTILVLLVLIALVPLFRAPCPNLIEVTVSGLKQEPSFRSMQLYYQYNLPKLRGFREYQSQKALIHTTRSQLQVVFKLPGLPKLAPLRLDFGMGAGQLRLHQIDFKYQLGGITFNLGTLRPAEIVDLWQPNEGVQLLETGKDSLLLAVDGPDPFCLLPVPRSFWKKALPPENRVIIGFLRAFLVLAAGTLVWAAYLLAKGKWLKTAGTARTPWWNRAAPVLCISLVAVVGYLVYRPFLNFQLLYLFDDVANDSVAAFFSIDLHLADYLRSEGWPLWSYSLGVGGGISSQLLDPFVLLQASLPPEKLAFGFAWVQYLKVLLAAGLLFAWFRLLRFGRYSSVFGTIALVFSAQMIVRGNWLHYATEVVVVAFTLVAVEMFFTRRFWQLVPIALVLLVMRGAFYTYVWTVVLLVYVFCRLFLVYRDKISNRLEALGKLILLYCLGLVMSGALILPSLYSILHSGRIEGSGKGSGFLTKMTDASAFILNEPKHYLSSLYGLFGSDILGRADFYSGWGNYLEGPHLYAGLLCLLLLPQVFLNKDRRVKLVAGIFLLFACAYIFIPWVRLFLNGFAGSYYKTSSFWISIFMVCLTALALDNLVRRRILNIPTLILTFVALLASLWQLKVSPFIHTHISQGDDNIIYFLAGLLLCCYFFLLICLRSRKLRSYGLVLLLLTLCSEAYLFSKGSTQDRMALRGDTMATKGFYFDDSFTAVKQLKERDTGFYRIEKSTPSVSLNDAMAQSYFGVKSYNSFNSAAYLRFLGTSGFDVDYEHKIVGSTSYITGLDQRAVLEALLSVKYYLSPDKEKFTSIVPANYSAIEQVGDWQVFENNNFIPFGFVYHRIATEKFALNLPYEERDLVALEAAIVGNETAKALDLPLLTQRNPHWQEFVSPKEGNSSFADYFSQHASQLAATAMQLTEFRQNRFSATAHLAEPGLLFFSIPMEKGWRFYANNRQIEPVRTHFGFFGLPLGAGPVEIRGEYFTPLLAPGIIISLSGLLLYCLLLLFTPFSSRIQSLVTPPHRSRSTF